MDIALALGGGGVKGHAHNGVMRVLEREGFHIQAIAGTSAGGLWGSFYAAGYTAAQVHEMMEKVDRSTMYNRRAGDGPAWLGLGGIEALLRATYGNLKIEELEIPFGVTAVDVNTAEPIYLLEGPLVQALMATIAVPGVFPPRRVKGRLLVDGGVINPVPVNLARKLAPNLPVVAVVLSPELKDWIGPQPPRLLDSLPFLADYISRLRIAKAFNLFLRSVDIGGAALTDLRLRIERPELIIRPDVPQIGLMDDVEIDEVTALGEAAAVEALPALHQMVSWQANLRRRMHRLTHHQAPLEDWLHSLEEASTGGD